MKILIVDDHVIVRDGLRRILSDEFKAATFGDASNATEALDRVWKEKWDLVLLDITMHGRTGLDVLKEIRSSASDLPVLILSAHPEEQYAVRVLRAGAAGYLKKESASHELCRAVKSSSLEVSTSVQALLNSWQPRFNHRKGVCMRRFPIANTR